MPDKGGGAELQGELRPGQVAPFPGQSLHLLHRVASGLARQLCVLPGKPHIKGFGDSCTGPEIRVQGLDAVAATRVP